MVAAVQAAQAPASPPWNKQAQLSQRLLLAEEMPAIGQDEQPPLGSLPLPVRALRCSNSIPALPVHGSELVV